MPDGLSCEQFKRYRALIIGDNDDSGTNLNVQGAVDERVCLGPRNQRQHQPGRLRPFTKWPKKSFHVWSVGVDASGNWTTSDNVVGWAQFLVSAR
jgi:hypothetical protein